MSRKNKCSTQLSAFKRYRKLSARRFSLSGMRPNLRKASGRSFRSFSERAVLIPGNRPIVLAESGLPEAD